MALEKSTIKYVMNEKNKFSFFPQRIDFWLFHSMGSLAVVAVNSYFSSNNDSNTRAEIAAQLAWIPLFTLSVLYYRTKYQKLQEQTSWKMNLHALVFSIIFATLTSFSMLFFAYQFTSTQEIESALDDNPETSLAQFSLILLLNNSLFNTLLIFMWIQTYNSIASHRRITENRLHNLRLKNSLKEAQLTSLTNQLNPHFLFNTLNNIKFTVRKDPLKSEKMITDLSDVLRYSLESSKREKVQVFEELEIVNRYIDIIKVHMETRLHFESAIPEDLYSNLIPPMVLQMLIENSIKHGIENLRHGGKVQLTAESGSKYIIFKITNDVPYTETTTQSTGIGLRNIEQRLKLLYGNAATINTLEQHQQFIVTLTLPRETHQ